VCFSEGGDDVTNTTEFADTGTHVLMITNHGVHEWQVTPGLPDTGGQNVYVNQFTEALIAQGYRVTIVNRGGYPHPITGAPRTGVALHPSGRARIVYIEDGHHEFVRKEDMFERVDDLVDDLHQRVSDQGNGFDLIISHYWDAGVIGARLNERIERRVPHVWIPHSLGVLKKRNVDPSTWKSLRIDERIEAERRLLPDLDAVVATSTAISETFRDDYDHPAEYFLPPCIDVDRYHPRSEAECDDVWEPLALGSPLTAEELRDRRIVSEISRTDRTKRKNVLIRAFAQVVEQIPDAALVVSLDDRDGEVYDEAMALIRELDLVRDVIVVGSIWNLLPCLYAATHLYCTPSVMEGFGMSAEEAAASGVPVVASDLVPFATEYLLGPTPEPLSLDGQTMRGSLLVGEGAIVAPADDVDAFARAMILLLSDETRRVAMGRRALEITIPYFTWDVRTRELLEDLGVSSETVEP
jgi:glycosyltransferase involved in cell wall biosynthesis